MCLVSSTTRQTLFQPQSARRSQSVEIWDGAFIGLCMCQFLHSIYMHPSGEGTAQSTMGKPAPRLNQLVWDQILIVFDCIVLGGDLLINWFPFDERPHTYLYDESYEWLGEAIRCHCVNDIHENCSASSPLKYKIYIYIYRYIYI